MQSEEQKKLEQAISWYDHENIVKYAIPVLESKQPFVALRSEQMYDDFIEAYATTDMNIDCVAAVICLFVNSTNYWSKYRKILVEQMAGKEFSLLLPFILDKLEEQEQLDFLHYYVFGVQLPESLHGALDLVLNSAELTSKYIAVLLQYKTQQEKICSNNLVKQLFLGKVERMEHPTSFRLAPLLFPDGIVPQAVKKFAKSNPCALFDTSKMFLKQLFKQDREFFIEYAAVFFEASATKNSFSEDEYGSQWT